MSSLINLCNIERFATHDGEGIRTVVFFQGCPLRCPWCANPESQLIQPHLMYNQKKCVQCHICENVCPTKSIVFKNEQFTWNKQTCIHCKACETSCLQNAIDFVGEAKSIDDIMMEVLKDKDYYETSNGGITISGGEPFVQFEAFLKLLKRCKKEQLPVTVETCGQYPLAHLQEAYPYIDIFYFDIKHVNPEVYEQTVKGKFDIVDQNMNFLVGQDPKKVVFRVPVIPNFNYDDKTLKAIIDMAKQYHVLEVHFLPYHTLGKVKYEKMMEQYTWSNTMLKEEDLNIYKDYAQSIGVTLKIGG